MINRYVRSHMSSTAQITLSAVSLTMQEGQVGTQNYDGYCSHKLKNALLLVINYIRCTSVHWR